MRSEILTMMFLAALAIAVSAAAVSIGASAGVTFAMVVPE
jgi:hypothetical protein